MDKVFTATRIEVTKALILKYEAALDALALNPNQSYTLDTGQTKQTVTRFDLNNLNKVLDSLYNRCATLEARLSGAGTSIQRPAW